MKIGKYEIDDVWLSIGTVALIVIAVFVFLSLPKSCSKPPDTPQQVLNEALAVAQAPLLKQIEDQKKQVSEFKNQLSASQSRYTTLVTQYIDLEKRKADVKAPTTNIEIRAMFNDLGYPPLPDK